MAEALLAAAGFSGAMWGSALSDSGGGAAPEEPGGTPYEAPREALAAGAPEGTAGCPPAGAWPAGS